MSLGPEAAASGRASSRRPRIGLTGPIGCGKSTVAGWLAEAGAAVVDADAVAREVTAPGSPALDAVFARFGPAYRRPDGTLDRASLGRLVFADPVALADLEAIVHPAVRPRIRAAVQAGEAEGAPAIVIEAIRLIEGGYAAECDEVWFVSCGSDAQRERLIARGMSPADADQRIAAQAGGWDRLKAGATRVIVTDGPVAAVRERVVAAYSEVLRERLGR